MTRTLAVFLPLLVAYGATWPWIWGSWHFREAYYEHCPIVVGLAAVMVWWRRDRLAAIAPAIEPRGWWLLGPGLALHLVGSALVIDSLSAASLILSVPGAVLLAEGRGRFRALLPILGLLPFVIPMPLVVSGRVAFELKEFAVTAGLSIANLFGAGAERTGASIAFTGVDGTLLVADPCSGLRSLVALVTLGYALAFFLGDQRGLRRWVILVASAPIAILSNSLRIAAICLIARAFGVDTAKGAGHESANVIAWTLDLVALIGLDALLTKRWRR